MAGDKKRVAVIGVGMAGHDDGATGSATSWSSISVSSKTRSRRTRFATVFIALTRRKTGRCAAAPVRFRASVASADRDC